MLCAVPSCSTRLTALLIVCSFTFLVLSYRTLHWGPAPGPPWRPPAPGLPPLTLPAGARATFMRAVPASPPLTRAALMALPSNFSLAARAEPRFGVTAVVSFYRRTWTLPAMVLRLLRSTVVPREIWLVAFASAEEAALAAAHEALGADAQVQAAAAALGAAAPPILLARGGMQLSYFGRFQLALAARTPFVAVFDDDTLPGAQALHTLLHMAHTALGEHSVLAARGHHLQWPMLEPFAMSARSPSVVEEDVVGGFWFAPAGLLRLLWRDRPLSLATSEDSQLCAAVRKYTGRSCLVAPVDPSDASTTTQEEAHDARGRAGDTTVLTNKMPERTRVTRELFRRGTPIKLRERLRHAQGVLVVVDQCWSARALAGVVAQQLLQASLPAAAWYVALTGACSEEQAQALLPPGFAQHSWPALDCSQPGGCAYENRSFGFFNLALGSDVPGADRPVDAAAEGAMGANALLELLQPRVVVAARSSAPATLGLALAAKFLAVPLLLVGARGAREARLLAALSVTAAPPTDEEAARVIKYLAELPG